MTCKGNVGYIDLHHLNDSVYLPIHAVMYMYVDARTHTDGLGVCKW